MSFPPIAETAHGPVAGSMDGRVSVFRNVPYAMPPLGDFRFRPPVPCDEWTEVRDCGAFGPMAPQNVWDLEKLLGASDFPQSEDCLSLNIWTPAADGKRPVMVWIHGGAFCTGTGATPWYRGTRLAELYDVVVVTINYRLGVLGFGYLAEFAGERFASSGMNGILDQVAALEWVRDNIATFGGDPANVTVFGESAGAMSVGTLLGTPCAAGLFRRAILQSGASSHSVLPEKANSISFELFDALGIAPSEAHTIADMPVGQIIDAQLVVTDKRGAYPSFQPVVDGRYLPVAPITAVRNGAAAGVDIIVGTNLEEMKLFAITDQRLMDVGEDGMVAMMTELGNESDERARAILHSYMDMLPGADLRTVWSTMLTDYAFRIPAIELAEAHHPHASVYTYLYTWSSIAFGGLIGSSHSLEIPFVFDNLHLDVVDLFTGGDAPGRQELATNMATSWTQFARHGTPTAQGMPGWTAYAPPERSTMIFDVACRLDADPFGEMRRAWEGVDFTHV